MRGGPGVVVAAVLAEEDEEEEGSRGIGKGPFIVLGETEIWKWRSKKDLTL